MKNHPKWSFLSCLAATTVAALLALAGSSSALRAGDFKKAPALKLPDLDGRSVEIKYQDGKVTLVNFWATWCLPCREEMPQIDRLYQKYRGRGFQAAGVALQSGAAADIKAFLEERKLGLAYPILLGTDEMAEAYGQIEIVPTTYLIGPGGEVLKTYFGGVADFEKTAGSQIESILSQPASPSGGS